MVRRILSMVIDEERFLSKELHFGRNYCQISSSRGRAIEGLRPGPRSLTG